MKKRIDVLLYEKGLAPSREKARTLIMAGCVYADNQKFDKPGDTVREDAVLEVRGNTLRYVSRGGLKLEKAMQLFPIKLENTVCMDIGASTGGFTDCMLQNGASEVYSVDVGYGQLAWQLRTDPRVVNLERMNARYLTREQKVGKKGVVRDKAVHEEVVQMICDFAVENGYSVQGLTFSPVKGPEGNIEYLVFLQKSDAPVNTAESTPHEIVEASHAALDKKD